MYELSAVEKSWRREKIKLLRQIEWRKVSKKNLELVSLIFSVSEIMAKEMNGISQRNQRSFYEMAYKESIEELWMKIKNGTYDGKEECLQVLYQS